MLPSIAPNDRYHVVIGGMGYHTKHSALMPDQFLGNNQSTDALSTLGNVTDGSLGQCVG